MRHFLITHRRPHTDLSRTDPRSGLESTHTFLLYLDDCPEVRTTHLAPPLVGQPARCLDPKGTQRGPNEDPKAVVEKDLD